MWLNLSNFAYKFFAKSYKSLVIPTMSINKINNHAQAMKIQRIKLKERNTKYAPGKVNLQVLGSGAKGAPKSLYLFTDQSRYLFNCGEGTQRLAHEHKMRLSKLDSVFITYPVWENLGGLLGLALTIQDVGVPDLQLHGPEGLDDIFAGTKRFVILKNLSITTAECPAYEKYEDHILTATYVPLTSKPSDSERSSSSPIEENSPQLSEEDDIDYYDYGKHRNASPHFKKKRPNSPPPENGNTSSKKRKSFPKGTVSMSYICQLKPRPGTLDFKKCVEHNVPPGPLLGQLKAGKDITLADGTVVKSSDVTEPDEIGAVFIILDCPNASFLDSLLSEKIYEKHQVGNEDDRASVIAHFSPPEVMSDPKYIEWMQKFPSTTQHIILNEANTCTGSTAVHKIQCKLNFLDETVFPLLQDGGIALQGTTSEESDTSKSHQDTSSDVLATINGPRVTPPSVVSAIESKSESLMNYYNGLPVLSQQPPCSLPPELSVVRGRTLLTIPLRPKTDIIRNSHIFLDIRDYVSETLTAEGFNDALDQLKQDIQRYSSADDHQFPQVIFLGTGSSIPNKTRNTSGILLRLDESSSMLLDCGEGTYGQLVRFFGSQVDSIIRQLKAVYVSHLHADHHLGLISLIKARSRLTQEKLTLFAPKQIIVWLHLYNFSFEPINQFYTLVPLAHFENHGQNRERASPEHVLLLYQSGIKEMTTTLVRHCPNAFGVALTTNSGYKITYSGDTMPCDSLVRIGENSDLLIHEATHEDELEKEAKIKMHSTVSQAIRIGEQMHAKFIMLTHFSQRYAKLPRLNMEFNDNVGIAFDNMKISLSSLPKLKLFYPALKLMFAEYQDEIENRALKRTLKQDVRRRSLENKL